MTPDTEAAAARLRLAESLETGGNKWAGPILCEDVRLILAERAEHLAHPAPAVVGEVTDATVEAMARAHSPRAWASFDRWFADHRDEDYPRHQYHYDMTRSRDEHLRAMRRAVDATPPVPPAVVPGWRMVPEEATQEMVQAALDTEQQAGRHVGNPDVRLGFFSAYRAMLASAPKPGEAK